MDFEKTLKEIESELSKDNKGKNRGRLIIIRNTLKKIVLDEKEAFLKKVNEESDLIDKSLDMLSRSKTKKEAISVIAESAVALAELQGIFNG